MKPDQPHHTRVIAIAALLTFALAIVAAWLFTPLSELASFERASSFVRGLSHSDLAGLYMLLLFAVLSLAFIPVTLLTTATALTFDPVAAFGIALGGATLSAMLAYGAGRTMGPAISLARSKRPRMSALRTLLCAHGFTTTLVARLLPVCNFNAINLLAGALRVPFRAFVLGSLFGLIPEVALISAFADHFRRTLAHPDWTNVAWLAAGVLILIGLSIWTLRLVDRSLTRVDPARMAPLCESAPRAL